MPKVDFSEWLTKVDGRDLAQTRDNVSRAGRVERELTKHFNSRYELNKEYETDRCETTLNLLSIENRSRFRNDINLPHNTSGLSSLKTSIRKYVEYRDYVKCSK